MTAAGMTDQQFLAAYTQIPQFRLDLFRVWCMHHWYAVIARFNPNLHTTILFIEAIVASGAPIVRPELAARWILERRGMDIDQVLREIVPDQMRAWDRRRPANDSEHGNREDGTREDGTPTGPRARNAGKTNTVAAADDRENET